MSLPDQIRDAVAACDYTRAARLFDEHARALRGAIEGGTCVAHTMEECRDLVAWARQMELAHRSHIEDRLQELGSRKYVAEAYR
jgi:hypothetical protein